MFSRLRAIYLRYVVTHADRLGGFKLPRHGGKPLGHVERLERRRGFIRYTGWTAAQRIIVTWPTGSVTAVPHIKRGDVAKRTGLPLESGFEVEVPDQAKPLQMAVQTQSGKVYTVNLRHPAEPPSAAAHRRMLRAFFRDLISAVPAGIRWMIKDSPDARLSFKRAMGLEIVAPAQPIDTRYFAADPQMGARRPITIIVPVYNAFGMLRECLHRVEKHTDLKWHVIVIDDASTDPRVAPFLHQWVEDHEGQATLIENPENEGFVASVNHGLALAYSRPGHVVLLNTDAFVPEGWASRLLAPIENDPTIASTTPMSNDAEIFSVPAIVRRSDLAPGEADAIDRVAQDMGRPAILPSAPTGVGFCMAMNARWLASEPKFDTAFGRGYGEEVDWCQKVRALGARHVCVPNLFVEHRGGQSFGAEEKQQRVAHANAMLLRRYPSYDTEVQGYIGSDPLATPRLALAIALAAGRCRGPMPCFVAHTLGGGAEHALKQEIEASLRDGGAALVLRVGGGYRWQLELHSGDQVLTGAVDHIDTVMPFLHAIPDLKIVYSCGVGAVDPITLPEAVLSLRREGRNDVIEARVHDYFMISPSYCLLNANGRYQGISADLRNDPAHSTIRPDGSRVSLRQWQRAWHSMLVETQRIITYSHASKAILEQAYPTLSDRIVVRPHAMHADVTPVTAPAAGAPVIGVLGNINRQKGAELLIELADRFPRGREAPNLVVIGNLDALYTLPRSAKLHGSYRPEDISMLTARYGVSLWLTPSVWPETFSFATREMLATGLPVLGFDIGGQGEALRAAQNGHVVEYDPEGDLAAALLAAIYRVGGDGASRPVAPSATALESQA